MENYVTGLLIECLLRIRLTSSCQNHLLPATTVGTHQSKVEYPSQWNICCLLKRLRGFFSILLYSRPHVCWSHQCVADQIHMRGSVTASYGLFHSPPFSLSGGPFASPCLKLYLWKLIPHHAALIAVKFTFTVQPLAVVQNSWFVWESYRQAGIGKYVSANKPPL